VSLGPDRSPHHVDDEESCDASHMSESTEQQHETKCELSIVEAVEAGAFRSPNSQKHRPLNTTEADCRQSFIARMGSRLGWTRASEATFEQTGPQQVMVCVPAGITLIVTQGDDGEWGWPVRDVRIRDECHHWDGRRSKRMKSTTFTKAGLREMRDKQMEFELWKLAQKQGVPYRERRRSARVATAVIRKSLSDSEEEEENIVMSDEHDTEYPPPRKRTSKGRGRSVAAHGHKRARAAARSPSRSRIKVTKPPASTVAKKSGGFTDGLVGQSWVVSGKEGLNRSQMMGRVGGLTFGEAAGVSTSSHHQQPHPGMMGYDGKIDLTHCSPSAGRDGFGVAAPPPVPVPFNLPQLIQMQPSTSGAPPLISASRPVADDDHHPQQQNGVSSSKSDGQVSTDGDEQRSATPPVSPSDDGMAKGQVEGGGVGNVQ